MRNSALEAVWRELEAVGIKPTVDPKRRHLMVTWLHAGQKRAYFLPKTPGEYRGTMNARADVRRMLRRDGMLG